MNQIRSVTSEAVTTSNLARKPSYSTKKITNVRIFNGNENMSQNLEAEVDSNNIFLFFSKTDLDIDLFTINKRFTVNNIDRYKEHDGDYLLSRKKECLIRDDKTYTLYSAINMRKIERGESSVTSQYRTGR